MRFSNYRALLSTSAVAAVLLGAMPAAAQDQQQSEQPQQAPEASSEDIVVTGIRSSLQGALNAKRNAAQVLDAISAEDIGKFPDKNVGEALQRVTGVQLTRSDGEGSGITIRGADPSLNRVEINGVTALSTTVGGGRDVDFRDLPSEFVNRLEVVKSATADMTEGGVGGTVRVITRRPFDNGGKPYLAGSAQAIYADIGDHMDPRLALIGSDTFANGTIGVLVSGTFENRNVESHQARTTGWVQLDSDPNTAGMQAYDLNNDGVGDFFPDIPRYVINRLETRRYALNGILEWRPSDDFKAYVESNWTKSIQSVTSQYLQTGTSGGIVDTENTIIGPDNTVEYLVMTNNTSKAQTSQLGVSYRNILGDIKRTTYNVALGADWTTGNLTLTPKISLSKAKAYNNEINATAAVTGMSSLIVDYSNGQNAPNIILPNDPTTTAGINQLTVLRRPRYDDQTEKMAKLDAEYKTDGGLFTSFKIGGQYRDLTVKSRFYTRTTTLNGFSDPAVQAQIDSIVSGNAALGTSPFFHTGNLGFTGDYSGWLNMTQGVADAVGIPDPFAEGGCPANADGTCQVYTDTWKVGERNLAGYGQASFAFDVGAVPVSGVIGARVVNTKVNTSGYLSTGGVISPVSYDSNSTEFLPSINMKAELIPNKLMARATATEVMARPLPQQLAPRFTIDVVGLSGSRGNPNLQPFRARQYDAGLEYYINRTSFASVTYFRKEISSFIQNTTEPYTDASGVTYTITVPTNGTQKVTINGVEAGAQIAFDFIDVPVLKQMGVVANYTYSKDSGYEGKDYFTGDSLPFQGLSRHAYNISAYYEDDVVSLRGAYNWRSKYLITAQGRGNNPEFGEAYGQLDASLNVTLMPGISMFLEGVNLLDATRKENANSVERRTIIETVGRRVYGGIRFKL
ncbi:MULTISPECIES: TonB-dependent receptor [Sphingobium]|uniref:TonB-dependent receptor n=1 Tax=Sphingobium yanoikuyae TaxID=13690 RepID=A0A0J9D7B7_SPHYA|nr:MULTISPECIES: TonB-dependent receptor [Sphingobium]ATP21269.1 TonB-dependent receptor [Sphingobium yanoikuyae]KMW33079.1 TonB-dependent receptor [Sphingobium yanoikuyae]QHD70107.1 TonB-dependent receptor [Sphingobium yanoikuyae]TKV42333.1 TonB-dependent receptor [Sphingobium sp. MP9-4]